MRPLAVSERRVTHVLRCDREDCDVVIPRGEVTLVTRDRWDMPRRFCTGECFLAWLGENQTRFACR